MQHLENKVRRALGRLRGEHSFLKGFNGREMERGMSCLARGSQTGSVENVLGALFSVHKQEGSQTCWIKRTGQA